ncbi:MAG TPA: ferric reductase-like transmembrane domain-containing protein [Pilimelia sp.]|nr:ferric reductase-like transmembrane domain-containing protein [Pilimelia sp.]
MAIRERAQRTAGADSVDGTGSRSRFRLWTTLAGVAGAVGLYFLAASTTPGRVAYTYLFYFMHFYAGVFILMGLTGTVLFGLVATDRIVLRPRLRVWMQAIHRSMAAFSMIFLFLHVWTKATSGTITMVNAFVPFTNPGSTVNLYLGFGPIAGYLMALIFWSGIARAIFADRWSPRVWRVLHSAAYLAWPLALLHGLGAGRRPAGWVTASYLICVALVTGALVLRMVVSRGRQDQRGRVARPALAIDAEGRQVRVVEAAPAGARGAERATNPLEERWAAAADSWAANGRTLVADAEPAAAPEPPVEAADIEEPTRAPARRSSRAATAAPPAGARGGRRAAPREAEEFDAVDEFDATLDAEFDARDEADDDEYPDWYEEETTELRWREDEDPADQDEDEEDDEDDDLAEVGAYAVRRGTDYAPRRMRDYEPRRALREESGRRARFDDPPASRLAVSARRPEPELELDFDEVVEREFDWLEPDDTPTLVDLASRRALREGRGEPARQRGRGRRDPRFDDLYDDRYQWREAQ